MNIYSIGDNMPYGDGTGPYGTGPVGRGLGPCGAGVRRGYGRGAYSFRAPHPNYSMPKEDRKKWLEMQKSELEAELEQIKREIEELK